MSANNPERVDKTERVSKISGLERGHQLETAVGHAPKTSLFEVLIRLSLLRGLVLPTTRLAFFGRGLSMRVLAAC